MLEQPTTQILVDFRQPLNSRPKMMPPRPLRHARLAMPRRHAHPAHTNPSCRAERIRARLLDMLLRLRQLAYAFPLSLATLSATPCAHAFCGFYVAGADDPLTSPQT
jgi:hypothetical protein